MVSKESEEWQRQMCSPGVSGSVVADLLCRALIASTRGHPLPNLHIHAIKLCQSSTIMHKKIGN